MNKYEARVVEIKKIVDDVVRDCIGMIESHMENLPPQERFVVKMRIVNHLFYLAFLPTYLFGEEEIKKAEAELSK